MEDSSGQTKKTHQKCARDAKIVLNGERNNMNKHILIWSNTFFLASTITFITIFYKALINGGTTTIQLNTLNEMWIEATVMIILLIVSIIRIALEVRDEMDRYKIVVQKSSIRRRK